MRLPVSACTDAFLAAAGLLDAVPRQADENPGLEVLLLEAHARARAAVPEVDIAVERFSALLGSKLDPGESPAHAFAQLHVEDLYLALGCELGLAPAQQRLVTEKLARIPKYVAGLSSDRGLGEEVQQDLSQRLLVAVPPDPPRIASYNGRGPLDSWLAVAAQRTALNLLKRHRAGVPDAAAELERVLCESPDPELQVAKAHLKQSFESAMRSALASLSPRDRLLLRLSVVSGLSCRKLGVMHGVHAATAARWIERIRDELFASIQRSLKDAQGISSAELPSLLGLVRSRLELSLAGLLDPDDSAKR